MRSVVTIIRAQEASAEPVTVGDVTVTPQSRALVVRWPGGALVWHHPTAVLVERDGQVRRIPIVDLTRIAQVGVFGLGLAIAIVSLVQSARRKEVAP